MGFPDGDSGKESTCPCRGHERLGFNPWVRKILWRREWHPTPVFLPAKFLGQRSPVGYRPWGCKESDTTKWTHMVDDEGGDLMNEISALIKEPRRSSLAFSTTWGHKKFASWKRAIARPWGHPDLRLPGSKTVRNTFLLFIRHPVYGILSEPPEKWRQEKLEADIRTTWFNTYCLFYFLMFHVAIKQTVLSFIS